MVSLLFLAILFVAFARSNGEDPRSLRNGQTTSAPLFTEDELRAKVFQLMGNDVRLFRFNAQGHTLEQRENGACKELPQIASMLLEANVNTESKTLILEYLTFCITDSPFQRGRFSQLVTKGIHLVVIDLVKAKQSRLSSMAAHLIYIASFSNKVNHQEFIKHGAVEKLAGIVLNDDSISSQTMWAAAALQNLAASYCETEGDGRCYWGWGEGPNVEIQEASLPMKSDGAVARHKMLQIKGLVVKLQSLACVGPVGDQDLKPSPEHVFPGSNAILGRDDNEPHMVTWAAVGALKNLALDPEAKSQIESTLHCFCLDSFSPDWLEKAKSADLISFLREGPSPCWFRNKNSAEGMCVDKKFQDDEGYFCRGYGHANENECKAGANTETKMTAMQACCGCGGGDLFSTKGTA